MSILPYLGKTPRLHPTVYVAEGAWIIGDVEIGADSSVWFNAVVRGDVHSIRIGERTNLQDLCVVHVTNGTYPTTIGNGVTVGHRATLHGCAVRDGCLIGMGAILLDGVEVGEDCLVAAGSLLTEGMIVPPRSLVMGAPAKVRRPLTEDEVRGVRRGASNYVGYVALHRRSRAEPPAAAFDGG